MTHPQAPTAVFRPGAGAAVRPPVPRPPITSQQPLTSEQYARLRAGDLAVRLHQGRLHGQGSKPSWFDSEVIESADRFTAWILNGQKDKGTAPITVAQISESFGGTEPADRTY